MSHSHIKNKNIKIQRNRRLFKYIYRNKLDKPFFQHDITHEDFKDLQRRIASDKVLRDKAFEIDINPKYDRYWRGLASVVFKFFDKKTGQIGTGISDNQELANESHKLITKKISEA